VVSDLLAVIIRAGSIEQITVSTNKFEKNRIQYCPMNVRILRTYDAKFRMRRGPLALASGAAFSVFRR
jgi:hypothetical protein